jgi:hypothetical protein
MQISVHQIPVVFYNFLRNVVVGWLTLLRLIPEVSGLSLGPKTGYPD